MAALTILRALMASEISSGSRLTWGSPIGFSLPRRLPDFLPDFLPFSGQSGRRRWRRRRRTLAGTVLCGVLRLRRSCCLPHREPDGHGEAAVGIRALRELLGGVQSDGRIHHQDG